jgi:hypothetical protein
LPENNFHHIKIWKKVFDRMKNIPKKGLISNFLLIMSSIKILQQDIMLKQIKICTLIQKVMKLKGYSFL